MVGYYPEDRKVYPCLSPCDGCKNPVGVMVWLTEKYPSLLERFSDGHSINGSQETSCINRKGFIRFLSYDLTEHVFVLTVAKRRAYLLAYCPPGRGLVVEF